MEIKKYKRDGVDTRLVAVSKLQSVEKIEELWQKGQRVFAENYVQEALPKIAHFEGKGIEWHFIGTLQRNKVKMVVGKFALIHSVHSAELLDKINSECGSLNIRQDILLSVNLAGEETKSGFTESEVRELLSKINQYENINMRGFMTMPPLFADAELTRPYFKKLFELARWAEGQREKNAKSSLELSMGTSHDYRIALSEGASLIRLGTLLFGERKIET